MSFETCRNTSFESVQEQRLNPDIQKIFDSLNFEVNPEIGKKLASLSPEIQAGLLAKLKVSYNGHQSHMAYIQNNANNEYLEALKNGISQA